ncbi:TPA_asm: hypothetical protein vir519_00038 [Caudoviricetes sp. vir519]|nr:TPA_asm: hypothetical protein vir519_00038 [Caudoviricetes sp. vir519]
MSEFSSWGYQLDLACEQLLKYAHKPGCPDFELDPVGCCCEMHQDLRTGIAWTAADYCRHSSIPRPGYDSPLIQKEDATEAIMMFTDAWSVITQFCIAASYSGTKGDRELLALLNNLLKKIEEGIQLYKRWKVDLYERSDKEV